MVVLRKINSSSLIETIVSLVIVSVLLIICTMISLNFAHSNGDKVKIEAYIEVDKLIREALINEQYFDKKITRNNYLIELNFRKFNAKNMIVLKAVAYNKDYVAIMECNRLIYMDNYGR